MPTIRLLSSDGEGHGAALAGHLRRLQALGPVLFVTADRPVGSWISTWAQASVDPARLFVIDAVSAMNGQQPGPGAKAANATYLPSPAMLEMMALRIEQLIRRHAPVRVVIDSLNTLAMYNGAAAVQAFAHYLANRLRDADVGADLIVHADAEGAALRQRLASFIDESLPLEAAA